MDLYSTGDLRRLIQADERSDEIKLSPGIVILRTDLRSEILWRIQCERWVSQITLIAAVAGPMAAIVAAIEAWPPH